MVKEMNLVLDLVVKAGSCEAGAKAMARERSMAFPGDMVVHGDPVMLKLGGRQGRLAVCQRVVNGNGEAVFPVFYPDTWEMAGEVVRNWDQISDRNGYQSLVLWDLFSFDNAKLVYAVLIGKDNVYVRPMYLSRDRYDIGVDIALDIAPKSMTQMHARVVFSNGYSSECPRPVNMLVYENHRDTAVVTLLSLQTESVTKVTLPARIQSIVFESSKRLLVVFEKEPLKVYQYRVASHKGDLSLNQVADVEVPEAVTVHRKRHRIMWLSLLPNGLIVSEVTRGKEKTWTKLLWELYTEDDQVKVRLVNNAAQRALLKVCGGRDLVGSVAIPVYRKNWSGQYEKSGVALVHAMGASRDSITVNITMYSSNRESVRSTTVELRGLSGMVTCDADLNGIVYDDYPGRVILVVSNTLVEIQNIRWEHLSDATYADEVVNSPGVPSNVTVKPMSVGWGKISPVHFENDGIGMLIAGGHSLMWHYPFQPESVREESVPSALSAENGLVEHSQTEADSGKDAQPGIVADCVDIEQSPCYDVVPGAGLGDAGNCVFPGTLVGGWIYIYTCRDPP